MVINNSTFDQQQAAKGFAAIGSVARLRVLQALVRAGEKGMSIGEIQKRTEIAASTLAHHLKHLTDAKLVHQRKNGRSIINRASYSQLEALAGYILHACCADENAEESQND